MGAKSVRDSGQEQFGAFPSGLTGQKVTSSGRPEHPKPRQSLFMKIERSFVRCRHGPAACYPLPLKHDARSLRPAAISSIRERTSASSTRTCRIEVSPRCFHRPLAAERAFPCGVFGPVENIHGRFLIADCRSRSRPLGVSGPRKSRFRRPAATRRGFGDKIGRASMTESPICQFAVRIERNLTWRVTLGNIRNLLPPRRQVLLLDHRE